jgi:hypothetical protein
VINAVDSDDPVEADGVEHEDSSPAKEAASHQVKTVYKSRRLREQEVKRAEDHKQRARQGISAGVKQGARGPTADHSEHLEPQVGAEN